MWQLLLLLLLWGQVTLSIYAVIRDGAHAHTCFCALLTCISSSPHLTTTWYDTGRDLYRYEYEYIFSFLPVGPYVSVNEVFLRFRK